MRQWQAVCHISGQVFDETKDLVSFLGKLRINRLTQNKSFSYQDPGKASSSCVRPSSFFSNSSFPLPARSALLRFDFLLLQGNNSFFSNFHFTESLFKCNVWRVCDVVGFDSTQISLVDQPQSLPEYIIFTIENAIYTLDWVWSHLQFRFVRHVTCFQEVLIDGDLKVWLLFIEIGQS